MLSDSRLLIVVAAAMIDGEGRVLVQRRPEGKPMAGLWEFPGGKVEPGEIPEAALARELAEELGVTIAPTEFTPLTFASETLGERHLLLLLYAARVWQGEAEAHHAAELRWVYPHVLREMPMPPADLPFIAVLERLVAERAA